MPTPSLPTTKTRGKSYLTWVNDLLLVVCSRATAVYPLCFNALSASTARGMVRQGTEYSAPKAVFAISFLGGEAVYPLIMSSSSQAPSAVRNMEPTLNMLRILSNRATTGIRGRCSNSSYTGLLSLKILWGIVRRGSL